MGNFFLGFPVARAKIADMISGAAPPLEHKDNHLPDGLDALFPDNGAASGKILRWTDSAFEWIAAPTPGITFPWVDYILHTHFQSLDGFLESKAGAGTVTLNNDHLILTTGGATADRAYVIKETDYPHVDLTWSKKRKFKTRVLFDLASGVDGCYWITIGQPKTETAIGFRCLDGILQSYIKTPLGVLTHTLEDWTGTPTSYNRHLAIEHDPSNFTKFYVQGSLLHTETEDLPAGTDSARYLLYFRLDCPSIGNPQRFLISEWMFWQEG